MLHGHWSQFRDFPHTDPGELPLLATAWQFSAERFRAIRRALEHSAPSIACVAVSGSLNRMESHGGSDLDLLIVIDDRDVRCAADAQAKIYSAVWDSLLKSPELQNLKPPKPNGVFSVCASWNAMTRPESRGVVDEDVTTFGQRMQLLLDAQPVSNDDAFCELRKNLLTWYSETRIPQLFDEAGPFHWLWQDVHRYWRSLRSRACWLDAESPRKSLEINVKLRSSRLVLIAGFLQAIVVAQTTSAVITSETIGVIQKHLALSPLERLTAALPPHLHGDLLTSYEQLWHFVATLGDDDVAVPREIRAAIKQLWDCLNRVPQSLDDWLY